MAGRRLGRLKKGSEFDSTYAKGSVFNGPLFVVRSVPNGLNRNRWGFAVGKKLVPKATGRNRVRRRLRAAAACADLPTGYDVVVTAKARVLHATFGDLERAMRQAADAMEQAARAS